MATAPRGYMMLLTKQITQASRRGSHRELAACVSRDAFVDMLRAAPVEVRKTVMKAYAKAWQKCEAKDPLLPATKAKVRWTDELVERLRTLAARYPDDVDLAKAMGLSVSQVSRARSRFIAHNDDVSATHPD